MFIPFTSMHLPWYDFLRCACKCRYHELGDVFLNVFTVYSHIGHRRCLTCVAVIEIDEI
jgi:hypothetical protein